MRNIDVDELIIFCNMNKKVKLFCENIEKIDFFVILGESCFRVKFMCLI
jgi:hypothetical protein